MKVIDLSTPYNDRARLPEVDSYIERVKTLSGQGDEVILTGPAPIWLYMKISHALHGIVRKLSYRSPVTGDVLIFDHSPY